MNGIEFIPPEHSAPASSRPKRKGMRGLIARNPTAMLWRWHLAWRRRRPTTTSENFKLHTTTLLLTIASSEIHNKTTPPDQSPETRSHSPDPLDPILFLRTLLKAYRNARPRRNLSHWSLSPGVLLGRKHNDHHCTFLQL